jgi:hypothetical protein
VTARLLDAETWTPIEGAFVAVFSDVPERSEPGSPDSPGSARSGSDGVVAVVTAASFCHYRETDLFGRLVEERGAPYPGYGAKGMRIEKPGYRAMTLEIPRETWRECEAPDYRDPRVAADLGDILLVRE